MLIIIIFILSLIYSTRHGSISYLLLFQLIVITAIGMYIANDIDVLYKADLNRPSDTKLYYQGYLAPWNQIRTHLFYEYPYFLRIFTFPVTNALYAVWGQSVLLFLLLDIIVYNKRDLLIFTTLHALIYTCTNLFKDNLLLLIGLGGYIVLNRLRNIWLQCAIVSGLIVMMAWVRPFLNFALPLGLFPLLFRIRSTRIKNILLSFCFIGILVVLYLQKDFIQGVINSFADDSSVTEGRSSIPTAIIKVLFGPTPIHYLFSQNFFVQPFLPVQSFFYALLHYIYYVSFSFFCVYLISYRNSILNLYKASVARLFLLFIALIQMFIYIIIYGSADIRQRGLILTFLIIFSLTDRPIFNRHFTRKKIEIFILILSCLTLLTFVS